MADTVRYLMEESIAELQDLEARGYFSKAELREVARRRMDFEYRLKRRAALKDDFLRFHPPPPPPPPSSHPSQLCIFHHHSSLQFMHACAEERLRNVPPIMMNVHQRRLQPSIYIVARVADIGDVTLRQPCGDARYPQVRCI